jgi:hypothetical protein
MQFPPRPNLNPDCNRRPAQERQAQVFGDDGAVGMYSLFGFFLGEVFGFEDVF